MCLVGSKHPPHTHTHTLCTHLAVRQLVPRLFSIGENLPEDHAEAPDVALRGELPVHDALRGHPADRQHGAPADLRQQMQEPYRHSRGERTQPVLKSVVYETAGLVSISATHSVVICAVDVSGHAKVPDLDHEVLPHQTVASGQVPVDEVQGRQVDHPRRDLSSDVKHLRQRELTQRRQLGLLQDVGVRTVSSATSNSRKRFSCTSVTPEDLLSPVL